MADAGVQVQSCLTPAPPSVEELADETSIVSAESGTRWRGRFILQLGQNLKLRLIRYATTD